MSVFEETAVVMPNESSLRLETEGLDEASPSQPSEEITVKDSPQPRSSQPCAHYPIGRCRFGDQCRYYHDPNITPLPAVSRSSSSESNTPRSPHKHNNAHYSPNQSRHHQQYNSHHNNHNNNGNMGRRFVPMGMPTMMMQQPLPPSPQPILLNDVVPHHGMILSQPPPPIFVNLPPNALVYSIDVECVATGIQHNARSVAQVSLVDQWARPLFNVYIKQDRPVMSYLTELTGITKELLEERGIPLADAMAQLRSFLSPYAILVGHTILKDVQWLQLAQGMDYHSLINLSDLFRVWNMTHNSFTFFSQDHIASVWLQFSTEGRQHNAVEDATLAISLFNAYRTHQMDLNLIFEMQRRLLAAPRIKGFSARTPVLDGCCMGNRKGCICGAPFE